MYNFSHPLSTGMMNLKLILLMAPGYRSPLRPIPMDSIPDPMFSSDSGQMMQHGGLTDNNIEYQLVNNNWEQDMSCYDEDNTESCDKDSWWIEAINLVDDIENMEKTWDSSNMVSVLK